MAFDIKNMFGKSPDMEEYVEIDVTQNQPKENKVSIKPFVLRNFDDVNEILNSLREGYTITIVDIKPLKTKDVIELKRAISKIKKTVDALQGSVAGFGDHTIIATPSFAEIKKTQTPPEKKERSDFING
jgi:SepF-like predicted cell division protein (DUF552 family)